MAVMRIVGLDEQEMRPARVEVTKLLVAALRSAWLRVARRNLPRGFGIVAAVSLLSGCTLAGDTGVANVESSNARISDQAFALVSLERSEAAWNEAQACIVSLAPRRIFPIVLVTDSVVNTARGPGPRIWMTAVRTREGEGVRIAFDSGSNELFVLADAKRFRVECAERVRVAAGR